jgi:hypothetical protein
VTGNRDTVSKGVATVMTLGLVVGAGDRGGGRRGEKGLVDEGDSNRVDVVGVGVGDD